MITKNCIYCNKEFSRPAYQEKRGNMKFCSHKCAVTHRNLNTPKKIKNPIDVFQEHTIIPDDINDCWISIKRGHWNYGCIRFNSNNILAHRFSYEHFVDKIPDGMFVCHHCDNPPCCNPLHLFLGTSLDNNRDRENKGRSNTAKGSKCGASKLNENDILEIRKKCKEKMSYKEIAKEYNIHVEHVGAIK
jgi:hypothetical protein